MIARVIKGMSYNLFKAIHDQAIFSEAVAGFGGPISGS